MALKLVQLGLSGAAMFGPDREVLQPTEVLYKKAVLVERGSFRPLTHVNVDMMECALRSSPRTRRRRARRSCRSRNSRWPTCSPGGDEWTDGISSPASTCSPPAADRADLRLPRSPARRLSPWRTTGASAWSWAYPACSSSSTRSTTRTARRNPGELRAALQERSAGSTSTRCCATATSPRSIRPQAAAEIQPLYDYLAGRGSFVGLDNYKPEYLSIFSRDVLKRIAADDQAWEAMVPPEACALIRKRGFFGHQREAGAEPGAGRRQAKCSASRPA